MIDKDELLEVIKEVSLAPSAHNTQPAYWKYNQGIISLSYDEGRCLPFADPKNRDTLIGLGASLYGMKMSLARRGFALTNISMNFEKSSNIVECNLIKTSTKEHLYAKNIVCSRYSHRGHFKDIEQHDLDKLREFDFGQNIVEFDKGIIKEIADDYDLASYGFLSNKSYFKELFSWLRFSKKNSMFYKDGLSREWMGLNLFEQVGAAIVMRPFLFSILVKLGLAKILISEKAKFKTVTGLVFIIVKKDLNPIEKGEAFYKAWLDLAAVNMAASPLSTIVDDPKFKSKWIKKLKIDDGFEILNIFKFGPSEYLTIPTRARLSVIDLLREYR